MFFRLSQLVFVAVASAAMVPFGTNNGIHLAVEPSCGPLSGAPVDINEGLSPLSSYKTIIAFGDGFNDVGVHDGSVPKPAVVIAPNPKAGGRVTNGPTWVEHLAADARATLRGYAVAGSSATESMVGASTDLRAQMNLLAQQQRGPLPTSTLAVIAIGAVDVGVNNDAAWGQQAGATLVYDIMALKASPYISVTDVLIVDNSGYGNPTEASNTFRSTVFSSLNSLKNKWGLKIAYVDLSHLWQGVQGSNPGYKAFGYTSPGACTKNNVTTAGACTDPFHTFEWIPGQPSKETHRIIADYVEQVLDRC